MTCNKVIPQDICIIVIKYKVYFILGLFSRSADEAVLNNEVYC